MKAGYLDVLISTSFVDQLVEVAGELAMSIVVNMRPWPAILIVGLSPLYVYGVLVIMRKVDVSSMKGKLYGVLAFLLAASISYLFMVVTIVLCGWGCPW